MAAWTLNAFSGEQPRVTPRLLPPNGAQLAVNSRLDDGSLTPLRRPTHESAFPSYASHAGFDSIFLDGDDWLGWPGVVDVVRGPVATERLYITGDGAPKMRVAGDVYALALPAPTTALGSSVSGTPTSDDITSRIYVYTNVTSFGEESEPSPPSDAIDWKPGQTVTLTGFENAPADRAVTKQRIYRTQTGSTGTDLYFIEERAVSTGDYTDTVPVDLFAEPLPSRTFNPPPDDLAGLTSMPNGMMAAFSGKDIYFCEPWQPHAWPEMYVLTVDFPIVALGAIGTSLIVMTTGNPYLVQGTAPESMQMVKLQSNLPCINARGVQDLGYAVAYPSHEGLVLATADGAANVATTNLFNREDWRALDPATMCSGQISGRYLATYNTVGPAGEAMRGTVILDLAGGGAMLSRSDITPRAYFYDLILGALYFLDDSNGEVLRFDPPSGGLLNQFWRSKPLQLPAATNFGAILIDGTEVLSPVDEAIIAAERAAAIAVNEALLVDPLGAELNGEPINTFALNGDPLEPMPDSGPTLTVNVYADAVHVATVGSVVGRLDRLPSGFTARRWEVAVFGTMSINQVALATTATELLQVPAS
jgi:hypothetical protein